MCTENKRFDKFLGQKIKIFIGMAKGKTGYPIVDAGMRQLWETGYMCIIVNDCCDLFFSKIC
ncbi:MAG: hypothetical protein CM15mP33_04450 [Candidatus Neomarinimicrobiota bacterium]|nr:MAG: hypothetical protein CM15mP33_04450 [Candidatus Neomarinimicrobiota bacterium]